MSDHFSHKASGGKYEAFIQEGSKAYLSQQYSAALKNYTEALKIAKDYQSGEKIVFILRYMIACCLVESDKWDDLAEAVMILQLIDLGAKKRFPAIYGVLAKAHCKLYRFKEALNAIVAGEEILSSTPKNLLQEFYIPGTNIAIEQDKEAESWKKVKAECSTFHQADAICFSKSCINITKPYTNANRNIFKKDPAFSGMVIVTCDNHQPCTCVYHPICWKAQKDLIYPVEKVSDKDMLGHACFVENCSYNNTRSVITHIEIIGANGETKTHIKAPENKTAWPTKESASNDAAKKPKTKSVSQTKNVTEKIKPVEEAASKLDASLEPLDSSQDLILVLNDEFDGVVDFSGDDPVTAQNKKFLLEVFESYISKNLVRVCDVYAKYAEYSDYVTLPDIDILNFLLSTGKVKILDDLTQIPVSLSQDDYVYGEIMEDNYSVIMSDNDKSSIGKPNKECKLKNFLESNTCEKAGGGDAPAQKTQKVSDKPTPSATVSSSKTVQQTSEHERKVTENKTLKDFISQLEADTKQLTTENENLKMELISKNSEVEALQKQLNENDEKWKTVNEKMNNFSHNYDCIKKENITLRTKIIDLLEAKEELEEKLSKLSNPEVRQKEILESFQEEYRILEEKINLEWTAKSEKLKEALQQELETRMTLLGKCLNNQYSSNRHLINGYIDRCNHTLEVINKINAWMTTTAEIRQFLDSSEWEVTKTTFAKALFTVQEEYQALNNKLHDDKSTDKYEMRDISLAYPNMPVLPVESISDYVLKALNAFHDRQRVIIQNLQQELSVNQAKLLNSQVPPHFFGSNYPQIMPPPGLHTPPPGIPSPSPMPGYNAFNPHMMSPGVPLQFKQMHNHLQVEMQQQMQDLQQEVQMMRRKLEENSQASYAGSITSSNKSLTSGGKGSPVKITPIITEPAEEEEQRDTARLNDRDQSTVNASGVRIVYDTGSCTGSIRDNASTASKDTYKWSEPAAPVTKPDEHQQQWEKEQERFKSFSRTTESWQQQQQQQQQWNREGDQRQQQTLSFERAAESYQHQQPTPFQRTAESYEHQHPTPFQRAAETYQHQQPTSFERAAENYQHQQPTPFQMAAENYQHQQQQRPTPYERPAEHHQHWQREMAHPAPAPLQRQPAETYRQPWEKEESRPPAFKKPADTYENWRRDTIHPAPFKKPAETHEDWRSEETRPAPFKKPAETAYQPWERNETYPPPLMRPSDNQEYQFSRKRTADGTQHWEQALESLGGTKANDEARYQDECDNHNRPYSELFDHSKPAENAIKITSKHEKEFADNLVIKYLLQDNTEEKREKRPNLDALVNRLKARYPGTSEADIIMIISEIRKRHHNSLTGLTVRQIVEESEEFFTNNQHIHLIRYFPNGAFETPAKTSGLQHARTDSSSSASYHTATKGPSSVSSFVNSPKKTWSPLPPEETKWMGSNDECSICTLKFYKNDIYTLNCGHSFHINCAKSWFKTQRTCPNCRVHVTEEDEFPPLH